MAAGLKRALAFAVLACALAPHASGVAAEILSDPTRPPAAFKLDAAEVAASRPVVQSIIITPHSRSAIIDNERVELNGRFRDALVAQITESEVVLRSATGVETLKMYPGIDKTPIRREPRRNRAGPGDKP